jgi:hypothetical protein
VDHDVITRALAVIGEQKTNGPCFFWAGEVDLGKLPGNLASLAVPFGPGKHKRPSLCSLILWIGWA